MKRLNSLLVLRKLKEKNVKIFTVFDFQRIFDIDYELAKKTISRYCKKDIFNKAKKGLYFLTQDPSSIF